MARQLYVPRVAPDWMDTYSVDAEFDADPDTDAMLAELSALTVERGPFVHPEA